MPAVESQAGELAHGGLREAASPLSHAFRRVEMSREKAWDKPSSGRAKRLRRRAFLVAKSLPVFPGQSVLELGAGSGAWTEHLSFVFGGQNPITGAVFNRELEQRARSRKLLNTNIIYVEKCRSAFPQESFDFVVGTDILAGELTSAIFEIVYGWLKPGGQFLFFMSNSSNPLGWLLKALSPSGSVNQVTGFRNTVSLKAWSDEVGAMGFSNVEAMPCEAIPPLHSNAGQAIGLILESTSVARGFSRTISLRGTKPGKSTKDQTSLVSLAVRPELFGTVSVVIPCHNEEANINRLVKTLLELYGEYIHEIVIVNDNSADHTAQVAMALAKTDHRVKLVNRTHPAGVGRALRDGFAAATGKYILSIDGDFLCIAPEFEGLFDAVADGCDGAIGSRFSSESVLIRYPFFKIVCNRGYHLLLNLLLGQRVRDVSNNLKLYRAEILKSLVIEENHFAANVETGLKPLLLDYRIREVPVSWINRTAGMGKSSFNLLKVGPDYLRVLLRAAWRHWRGQYHSSR